MLDTFFKVASLIKYNNFLCPRNLTFMKKALILVDLQNDFMPGGSLAVDNADEVIPVANRVQQYFKYIIATQDWHPKDHTCFATNHKGRFPGEFIQQAGLSQILWPVHCVQNTKGAEFVKNLKLKSHF